MFRLKMSIIQNLTSKSFWLFDTFKYFMWNFWDLGVVNWKTVCLEQKKEMFDTSGSYDEALFMII